MLDESPVPSATSGYAEQLFDLADVIMLVLDVHGRVARINPKGCQTLGYRVEDMLGKDWIDHFLPEDIRQETRRVFHRLVNGEDAVGCHHDNAVLTASGETRYIEWHNAFLRDVQGRITHVLSSGLDVTERRQSEQALRDNEEHYKALFHGNSDAIFLHGILQSGEPDHFAEGERGGLPAPGLLRSGTAEIVAAGHRRQRHG